ncbi:MAG: NUDIX domain-containing protein [Patescibacteria group bacterium]
MKNKLILLEGFWGAGKSTISYTLRKQTGVYFIPEPVRPGYLKSQSKISQWYIQQHGKRIRVALHKLQQTRKSVVCERSLLSTAAFEYATHGSLTETMKRLTRDLCNNKQIVVIYVKPTPALINRAIFRLKDDTVLQSIHKNRNFIFNYDDFFLKVLPVQFSTEVHTIMTNIRSLESLREKIYEVSAAGVVVYNRKVVILYDEKYNHYVLPQGHRKENEILRSAARREVIEETGYVDLEYAKKLYSYQYHFPRGRQTVYKKIHVYLFNLKSEKRKRQVLENHEAYESRLVSMKAAVKILHWDQDKIVIRKAQEEIKRASIR